MKKNLGYEKVALDKRIFAFVVDIVIKTILFFAFLQIIIVLFVNPQTKGKPEQITEINVGYNLNHPDYVYYGFSENEILIINEAEEKMQIAYQEFKALEEEGKQTDADEKFIEYEEEKLTARKYCLDTEKACTLTEEEMTKYLDDITPILTSITIANLVSLFASIIIVGFLYSFFVPIFFKNGQTLGRRIFKIGLVTNRGRSVKPIHLFIRVTSAIAIYFGIFLISGVFIQIIGSVLLVLVAKMSIHDFMSNTVMVDLTKQTAINPEAKLDVV